MVLDGTREFVFPGDFDPSDGQTSRVTEKETERERERERETVARWRMAVFPASLLNPVLRETDFRTILEKSSLTVGTVQGFLFFFF